MIDHETIDSGPSLVKKFVYDLEVTDPFVLFDLIGLVPPSPDGHEMELSLSSTRLDAVENLMPVISTYCGVAGGIMCVGLSKFLDPDTTDTRGLVAHITYNLMSTMRSVISGLHDIGVIRPVEIRYMTEEEMNNE